MNLAELFDQRPTFAWLHPKTGQQGIRGVQLSFLRSVDEWSNELMKDAVEKQDVQRQQRINRIKNKLKKTNQQFVEYDIDWWMNEEEFFNDRQGFGGTTLTMVRARYPNIQIKKSKKQAIDLAKQMLT